MKKNSTKKEITEEEVKLATRLNCFERSGVWTGPSGIIISDRK